MPRSIKDSYLADSNQVLQGAYNDVDKSLSTAGFLVGKVGRKVSVVTVAEVETYSFYEDAVLLYELTLTYTDSTKTTFVSAERTV